MPILMVMLFLQTPTPPRPVICIDPGHPSEVGRGTRGKHITEIEVAWSVATKLRDRLAGKGYAVVMTKSSEQEMVFNRRRAEIANDAHASLMIRLHCDAASESGFTVYYPTRTGTSGDKTGPSAAVLKVSASIAKRFHDTMAADLKGSLSDLGLKSDDKTAIGSKQGALTGSIYSKVPVLLVEMVVLTNPADEEFISGKKGMDAMVRALADGVLAAVPVPEQEGSQRKKQVLP